MRRALFLVLVSFSSVAVIAQGGCGDSTFTSGSDGGAIDGDGGGGGGGNDGGVTTSDSGRDDSGVIGGEGGVPPASVMHVFVTSTTYDGKLGGVDGANARCKVVAQGGGLAGDYHAWISSTAVNAFANVNGKGPWYLPDGTTLVFNNHDNLLTIPQHAIDRDESGNLVAPTTPAHVWTGSSMNGTVGTNTCGDWGVNAGATTGDTGDALKDQTWGSGTSLLCTVANHLVCFEQ